MKDRYIPVQTCPTCQGYRRILSSGCTITGTFFIDQPVDCPTCYGHGTVPMHDTLQPILPQDFEQN